MKEKTEEEKQEEKERNHYKKSNLHLKVMAQHPERTRSHVQQVLNQDYTTQLTQTQHKEEAKGHIVATTPNELWQFDIFDLSRYAKKNNNIRYLLACVDVFTRKAYVEPMEKKFANNVKAASEDIL